MRLRKIEFELEYDEKDADDRMEAADLEQRYWNNTPLTIVINGEVYHVRFNAVSHSWHEGLVRTTFEGVGVLSES